MDMFTFVSYLRCLDRINAEERLMDIRVNSFTDLKKTDREKLERRLDKAANPEKYKPVEIDKDDVKSTLSRIIDG